MKTTINCPLCRQGELVPGTVTVTLERDAATVVYKDVPAEVCNNCSEEYVGETATQRLLESFDEAVRNGVVVDVRHYVAA